LQIDDEGSLNTPPQKPVLTVWASLVPGDAGAVTTPEHTALMEQSACQNRSCAPLLLQTLCWSGKACQSSRGPNRLCMRRCRPPSWCTALPAAVDTTFMVKMRLADVFRVILSDTTFPDATICNPAHHAKSGSSTAKYIEYDEMEHPIASRTQPLVPPCRSSLPNLESAPT